MIQDSQIKPLAISDANNNDTNATDNNNSAIETITLPNEAKSTLYKTEMCRKYEDTGFCR